MGTPGKTGMGINWNNRKMGITGIPEKMGWGIMETSGLESWEFPGKNGMGTPRNTSMGIHRNSWGKRDWLQEFPRKQDGHQKFLGKMGLAPAIPWESGMGIPRKLGWTLGIPRKTEFIPKKKK